ncbi:FtsX-like permease family protein [Clostridiaceae bacterium M8S5]|nr:FtsX-like permease family protein [Clostridiaceae bacterium M8S5]
MKNISSRYLKVQKKRTILTILGVIMSVALITGIFTIITSVQDKLIRSEINRNGSYHITIKDLTPDKVDILTNYTNVKKHSISTPFKTGVLEDLGKNYDGNNRYRKIKIKSHSNFSPDITPVKLKEGSLPTNSNELVVDTWVLNYLPGNAKIGDNVTLDLGEINKGVFESSNKKEYKIVGTMYPNLTTSGKMNAMGLTFLDENNLKKNEVYSMDIELKSYKDINSKIKTLANDVEIPIDNIRVHNSLLGFYGESSNTELNAALFMLVGFIVLLVVISTIAVIFNSFNISVIERASQFGVLRCVGSTPAQIRKIVFKEAVIISIIGIPIGLLCGTFAMKVVFYVIGHIGADKVFSDINVVISPLVIIVSSIIGFLTIIASAFLPARIAAKVSPLEAVRSTGQFKKDNIKRSKLGTLIHNIFGFEAGLAWKNLRRNRKRFLITVFSMVISIVLFIVFNSFLKFTFDGNFMDNTNMYEFMISNRDGSSITEKEYNDLVNISGIDRVFPNMIFPVKATVSTDTLTDEFSKYCKGEYTVTNNTVQFDSTNIMCYGDNNLDLFGEVITSGEIDINTMNKNNGVILIKQASEYIRNPETGKLKKTYFDLTNTKVGDTIPVTPYKNKTINVKVAAIADTGIFTYKKYCHSDGFIMITSKDVYKNIIGNDKYNSMNVSIVGDSDNDAVAKSISAYCEKNDFDYVDLIKQAKEYKRNNLVIKIFLYGFVSVITLISCLNIINTINTNLLLRTKEFSILKAVGMSEFKLKKMVCFEGLYYGIISSLYGVIIGVGLSYLLFNIVTQVSDFGWNTPWNDIAVAIAGVLVFTLLSAYIPLRRMNKQSLVDNIRKEH